MIIIKSKTVIGHEFNYAPVIENQTFNIGTYPPTGTLIGTIVATDPNPGQTLTYEITAGNSNNIFTINSSTGELFVGISVVAYYPRTFYILVEVTDNGTPTLSDDALISVVVS